MDPLGASWVVPAFTVFGTLTGAAISGLFGWLESRRRTRNDEKRQAAALSEQLRAGLTGRASEFLAAEHHTMLSVRDVALAAPGQKHAAEKTELWPTVDRANGCLAAVRVNDSDEVVAAAVELDRALVELCRRALVRQYELDDWEAERATLIGDLPDRLTQLVRREARALQSGRPELTAKQS